MIKSDENKLKENEKDNNEKVFEEESGRETSSDVNEDAGDGGTRECPTESGDVNEELIKKEKEIESLTDMLKRRQADFENYKKRMAKNLEEYQKLAIKDFAFDIININDDLLRAIDAASNIEDEQTKAFVEGVSIISNRIVEALKKYGIEEIDSFNREFDPNFNEAVEIDMSEDVDVDTITGVYQKGFKLDDYVIRCARVKVTKPLNAGNNSDAGKQSENEGCENTDSGEK